MAEALFIIYPLSFAALFALPRWSWLVAGSMVAVAVSLWYYDALVHEDSGAVAFEMLALFVPVVVGFAAGAVGRAIILLHAPERRTERSNFAIGFSSFIGAPIIVIAMTLMRVLQW